MRAIAGPGGITPSILHTRTSKEAAQDVQLYERHWKIRKVGVRKEMLGDVIPGLVPLLVPEPQMSEAIAISYDAVQGIPIPATQLESSLSMEFNSIWNGQSSSENIVQITRKRKRSK